MKGFKAFGKGLVCRGKQYKENTVFEEQEAVICRSGMHFCENPLDVLDYYPLVDSNGNVVEVAEVEALDECQTEDNKKYCTKKLKIGFKLSLSAFVKAAIDFALEKSDDKVLTGYGAKLASSGDGAKLASSGDYAKLASSGYGAKLASSGYGAKLASSGDYAQLAGSGDYAKLASSGDYAKLASSGYGAKLASSGDYAKLASSGYGANLASSGDYAKLAGSGDCAQLAGSGDYAQLASLGDYAMLASSGDYAKLASSGDYAKLASLGYGAKLASSGDGAVIAGIGRCNTAKGKKGSWLVLTEWGYNDIEGKYIPVCVKAAQIDGAVIKEDTFYKLENGEFKEA